MQAWLSWVILTVLAFIWGVPQFKAFTSGLWAFKFVIPGLDKMVLRGPPVMPEMTAEGVMLSFSVLPMAGTGILISVVVGGLLTGYSPPRMLKEYWNTIKLMHYSLLTIYAMFGIGYLMHYSGLGATLSLAFAHMSVLYPLPSTVLGWLDVALTGSDTASNVLLGGLQKTTVKQLDLSPIPMPVVNSSGGVVGKMIDA